MNIIIEEHKISITDENITVFLDFVDKIDDSKIDWYLKDLQEELKKKKEEFLYLDSIKDRKIELSYKNYRQSEYPPIEEQLDMLYWDLMTGTDNWKDKITEIKTKYPKPSLK